MHRTLLTLTFCWSFLSAFAQMGKYTWTEATALAAKENKLILVLDEVPVCATCKQARALIAEPEFAIALQKDFILASFDELRSTMPDQKLFSPVSVTFPVFYFVNGRGEMVHRQVGFYGKDAALQMLELAKDSLHNLGYYKQQDKAGKLKKYEDVKRYCELLQAAGIDAETRALQYLGKGPGKSLSAQELEMVFLFVHKIDNPYHAAMRKQKPQLVTAFGAEKVDLELEKDFIVYMKNASQMLKHGPEFLPWANRVLTEMAFAPDRFKQLSLYARVRYLKTIGETRSYMLAADSLLTVSGYKADYALLNEVAYDFSRFAQTTAEMEKALNWSQRSFAMESYSFNAETVAGICTKLGRKKEALRYINLAIDMAVQNEDPLLEFYKLRETEIQASSGN